MTLKVCLAVLPLAKALVTFPLIFPDCTNGPELLVKNLVCDASASPSDRAAALVAAMNTAEKLENLIDMAAGAERLGLPEYEWWNEALHGIAQSPGVNFSEAGEFSYATSFAQPILLSAAFDDSLVEAIASTTSTEIRAFSNAGRIGLNIWTPNINPYRDPRWGRGAETPGEDPFRIKGYVKHLLRGLEAPDDGKKKVIATCKHFAAYDLENWNGILRHKFNAQVTTQDLSEYYLPPFQQCARDSQVGSIMCSYNALNGVPACQNTYLMHDILRDHWNWKSHNQYITSDCFAIYHNANNQSISFAESAGKAITAGIDSLCTLFVDMHLPEAHNVSYLTDAIIDRALRRQYEALVRVGYFDSAASNPYRNLTWDAVNTAEAQLLARQSAAKGMVLLKNDGVLPLKLDHSTSLAVIGMWANATEQMLGQYSGIPPYYQSPLYAAQQFTKKVFYASGPIDETSQIGNWTALALSVARQVDYILYFGGIDNSVEAEEHDRPSISWSQSQLSLIQQLSDLGKPLAVVQLGNQLDSTPVLRNDKVSALLWAGYPGQAGGTAAFDILTGAIAPAGRLPVTQYPAEYVDQVPLTDMSLRRSVTNPGRTYKFFNKAVLPYGYGLHYSDFSVNTSSNRSCNTICDGNVYHINNLILSCNEEHLDLCTFPHTIPVNVKNIGKAKSDFVVLAFVSGSFGPEPYPIKELTAYKRLSEIYAGESRGVQLPITLGNLARVDEKGHTILYPGTYTISIDVPTQSNLTFILEGEQKVLDTFPQPI